MGYFARAWKGEAHLWTVFWLLGLMLIIPTIILFVSLPFMFMSSPLVMMAIMVLWIFTVNGYQLICIWRCAFNCKWKGWAYIARIIVVFGAIGLLMNIATISIAAFTMEGMQEVAEQVGTVKGDSDMDAAMKSLEDSTKKLEQLQKEIEANAGGVSGVEPAVAPQAVGASQIPAPAPLPSPADACKEKLRAHAVASGADAEAYIAQNQAWIDGCVQKATAAQ